MAFGKYPSPTASVSPNPRHLETFHYVVGGINRAVGRMPYSIQQPAISEQMKGLEDCLGCRLFRRQPFGLTATGHALHAMGRPYFEGIKKLVPQLRGRKNSHLRIAADECLVGPYLSRLVRGMAKRDCGLNFTLSSGTGSVMSRWLQEGDVDLVVTGLDGRAQSGLASKPIVTVPLVLIADKTLGIKSADQLWEQRQIDHPLVCPPPTEAISQAFREGLERGSIHWPTRITASSGTSVVSLVIEGHIGVTLDIPSLTGNPDLRILPLRGFEPVQLAVLWRRADTARLRTYISALHAGISTFFPPATARRDD
jgi:DNA-binding transcriptional LysR family regulator